MKLVITGSLGNISRPRATALGQQGHTVTVISSQPDRRAEIEALGAHAAIGSLEDADSLARTFTGADAVYAMVPPNFTAPDLRVYFQRIAHHYAQAIQQAGIRRVVQLSSWGQTTTTVLATFWPRTMPSKSWPPCLGWCSSTCARQPSIPIIYGFLGLGMIKNASFLGANCPGSHRSALVHPLDIAAAAA